MESKKEFGDMPVNEFRKYGYQLIDWIADYLENIENIPVLPNIEPGSIKNSLPPNPPEQGESMSEIISDVDKVIMPGMTHWNHPKFMAYFNSSASGPGILAELLSGAFNINGMLWKSCPSATELEQVTLNWLKQMLGLPEEFWGIIYDGASSSSMHAIAAARENFNQFNIREKGLTGRNDIPRLRLYVSEAGHSSVDKGAITLGIGIEGISKIPVDSSFQMLPEKLDEAIKEDLKNGLFPFCVVATVGSTSTTSIDPVDKIGDICKKYNLWLHIDAAHAGIAAIVPKMKHILNGCEKADSIVVNPHKWMFLPIDLSTFYTRKPEVLKRAFSLVPEYLKTSEDNVVENYMDYGIQLGRRFRSLKLWFVIRYFGRLGLINRIEEHLRLGKLFARWIDEHPEFELSAPVPLSTVCFRAIPNSIKNDEELNKFNELLLNNVNSTGKVFLTHTKLGSKFVIRLVVSGLRTNEKHVTEAWELLQNKSIELFKNKNAVH